MSEGSDPVIALLISDLHLSLKPPLARSCHNDWLAVQAGYLRQLEELLPDWSTPIVCAGDVLDKWAAGPELLNWLLDHLPHLHAIPGQHDLRHHSLADLKQTSFWSLVKAGKITYLEPGFPVQFPVGSVNPGLALHGFPWGKPLEPLNPVWKERWPNAVHVAVVHQYLWVKDRGYAGAPEASRLARVREKLRGYAAAVFGDNHHGFLQGTATDGGTQNGCSVFNHGCFIRRKADEEPYRPAVGLLHASGRIRRHYLDTSGDRWLELPGGRGAAAVLDGLDDFVAGLEGLGEDPGLDFDAAVRRFLEAERVPAGVRRRVLAALEGAAK